MEFDVSRAVLQEPDTFQRFRVPSSATPLIKTNLKSTTSLLLFERGGERRALLTKQMIYHHVAQGELAGEPFVITF